ncbi:MAG: APC family permease [Oscillospiraceae bacterium]|nr:APC family permease [Oscillospiraceae bacterium]
MGKKLERKYGLFTAICLVVGIVIGSGVFFKAQTILMKTGGNMPMGIAAWIIGGAVMIVCILAFSAMAQKYEQVNGIVDYAEATLGRRYAYYVGWFMTTAYYPTMTSALAWLSARYTLVFLTSVNPNFPLLIPAAEGGCVVGPECMALMMFYLCFAFAVNTLAPKLAGRVQVSTTVIKLIPLGLMAVVGIIYGCANGQIARNFATAAVVGDVVGNPLFAAVCATSFAYEGWIIATSINAELIDSKRNLPKALIAGGIIIMAVYIAYYVGVAGGASNQELIDSGATVAFTNVFGNVLGNILNLFIAISCIGTMNGLMLGSVRGLYSIAVRGHGPKPAMFAEIDDKTNMPANSCVVALVLCAGWGLYFYLSNLAKTWTGPFVFDPTELPILTMYALYIPIFVAWMKKSKGESVAKRYVYPILAILGSLFMVAATILGHGFACVWYLIVFGVIMLIGALFYKKSKA